ncbi:MAG: hypothetical protein C5B58_00180 [Acidobacteria bacterium]|nr:MAG: hypothetical protein C5B58_00180 [Acidobacteriota bacterium]
MATSIHLRLRKNEQGEALIITLSVIGFAVIVTVAAFLLSASFAQDTERVAAAKVDIATREDALLREILQQMATGIFPANVATGVGLNWTPIMTNAVNQLRATSYVDPAEVSTLLSPGVIPANMGDPDDGSASLSIFQGYNVEVPFGGTAGVANLVGISGPAYNPAVEPPELVWVSNSNISATTAATNPSQFLLGSQVSAVGTPGITSPSGRWGIVPFPNIRFGLMQPGTNMVARRVWWRIPVLYQTALQTIEAQTAGTNVSRYPGMLANYILSVYEIPSQLPITGNGNIQLGLNPDGSSWGNTSSAGNQVQISGSIYGDAVQLNGGTYGAGISSRTQVNVLGASSVAGESYTDNTYNNLGVREASDLTRAQGAAPVSVAGDTGKVLMVPVSSGNTFYLPSANATPTAWDLYSLPYYHCRIRITISGTNNTLNYQNGQVQAAAGAITVQIRYLPDTAQQPDAVFGIPDNAAGWNQATYYEVTNATTLPSSTAASNGTLSIQASGTTAANMPSIANFFLYTSTATGVPNQDTNVLEIDLLQLYNALAASLNIRPDVFAAECYSIYIGCNPSQTPGGGNNNYPNIVIKDADDLTGTTQQAQQVSNPAPTFTNGLSIVSTQRIYIVGGASQQNGITNSGFNTVPWPNPPDPNNPYPTTSMYAPDVRYGMTNVVPTIAITGQVSVSQATTGSTTAVNPLSFSTGANTAITGSGNSYKLNAISMPSGLNGIATMPPITRLYLLFTVEKERTN